MRITLELNENQAALFQDTMTVVLQSLAFEEAQCMNALDGDLTFEQLTNLNDHLAYIKPQRILVAEILHTIIQSDKKTRIITRK